MTVEDNATPSSLRAAKATVLALPMRVQQREMIVPRRGVQRSTLVFAADGSRHDGIRHRAGSMRAEIGCQQDG
jgi:hypothetical protein